MLTQKLRAEAEMEGDEEQVDEELDSTGIGSSTSNPTLDAHTEFEGGSTETTSGEPGAQVADFKKVADINEEEGAEEMDKDAEIAELRARLAELEGEDSEEENPFAAAEGEDGMDAEEDPFASMEGDGEEYDVTGSEEEDTEDDMDLEAIIRELEAQLGDEEGSEEESPMAESDEVDLEEILREMEADMKGDEEKVDEAEESEKDKEIEEAYKTIKSLQRTINEVNLLNAKLLFANKLFRAHNMTNEQKVKVIETLDRTKSVREVKLVFSTLAENFKYTSTTNKTTKKSISEGIASKAVKSTAPKAAAKQVIAESADFANRVKKLAGIIK
jgi:hypothetical protein